MDDVSVKLTPRDQEILDSYGEFCERLSVYLGPSFEIVLHSLGNLEHSAIRVLNGFHTGRTVGAPITNTALTMLTRIRSQDEDDGYLNYFSETKDGSPIKAATIPVFAEAGKIIGLVCINFSLDTPLSSLVAGLIPPRPGDLVSLAPQAPRENYVSNASDLVSETIADVRREVLDDYSVPASNKNKAIIALLRDRGVFNFKNSIAECASLLGVSRTTVYMHLRNLDK